ncbi:MAG: tripartite tricarboxylate transporter TctB family protein [Rhodospirillales bacterium]|jgi:putative tricarboxylic transport membrane protein
MSNMRTRNLIAAIVLLFLCAGYAYLTAHLPTRAIENTTQPSFFPWVITFCLAVLSLFLLAQGLLPIVSTKTPAGVDVPAKRLVFGLILSIAYLIALPILGFAGANIPLFAGLMMLYGERRPIWIIGGSVLISLFVFYLFREGFQILLPAGILDGIL